jgi:uncharacterized protein
MRHDKGIVELDLEAIATVCRTHHVGRLSLFGSAARGEAGAESDLDFIVDFEPDARPTLLTLIGLQHDLEDLTGRKVDVVTRKGLKPLIRERVLAEARAVYAR